MNNLDSFHEKSQGKPAQFAGDYSRYVQKLLAEWDLKKIGEMAEVLQKARLENKKIFFLGNGGSAATASHFVNDLSIGTRDFEKPFRCIGLSDNVPVMTAIANDFGYDDVFVLQLKTLLEPSDVVVAISASGNSPNVLKAIEYANTKGACTIGLTGFDGGKLAEKVTLNINIATPKGEYGPVEDMHMILDHLLCSYLMRQIRI